METSNEELIREWRKIDPLLEDLEGFERFCEIRVAGGAYPLNEEDIFLTVETVRREWSLDRFPSGAVNCIEYSMLHDCIPRENADKYWERNDKAAVAVIKVVADWLGHDPKVDWKPKDGLGMPLHLNDCSGHLEWIKETFGLSLTKRDFEDAWKLFEHKEWFDESGYYIRGWLAVAEALGIGQAARKALETTPYPHADNPQVKEENLCEHMKVCPIHYYREYLKVMSIDIPDDVFNYDLFQSNLSYYVHDITKEVFKQGEKEKILEKINSPRLGFKVKWKIRKMIKDYMRFPRCRVPGCGAISYHPFENQLEEFPLCWNHQQIIYKVWRTKIRTKELRKTSKKAHVWEEWEYSIPPRDVETELRIKLINGDELFDGVTFEE